MAITAGAVAAEQQLVLMAAQEVRGELAPECESHVQ
jgi:hypothetical protein